MKRSLINKEIELAMDLCRDLGFALPDFAYWTPEEWEAKEDITERMRKVALGWDVTDYNSNDFDRRGAVLFTLRNGEMSDPSRPYCEKMIAMKEGQELPFHFHYYKTEDIINRAGGVLCVQVYNSTSEEDGYQFDTESDVELYLDGIKHVIPAGGTVKITNGNSITLTPYVYHRFYAEGGPLVVGEVSRVNNDATDNHFIEDTGMTIQEDEPIRHNLCGGYITKSE